MSTKYKFLKPGEASFSSDRSDVDPTSGSSFVYNPNNRQPVSRQRQLLPVYGVRNHLLYLLEQHQTLVVVGETGSGKSTQIPQYLLESGWCAEGTVVITQPRRVACTGLAARVAEERDCLLGDEVGYNIRFDDCSDPARTRIKFMTEAILVREMMADPLLRQYSAVMLDEVHERTLFTDILLGLLKKILKRRKDLRVIVCSATIDADHMLDFFNFNKTDDKSKDTAAVLSISGRTYPVDVHYIKEPCPDYVNAAASTAASIHRSQPPGDVLVFLTGVNEVQCCVELVTEHMESMPTHKGSVARAVVLPLHGSLSAAEQLKALLPAPPALRKIIVATNIAETSLTIAGVVYVVDCGLVKLRVFGISDGGGTAPPTESLAVVTASKASATQRAGRAGRTRPGKVYRLYPEAEYEKLPDTTPPEMVRSNLSPAVLNLLALGIDNMLRFDFPSPPPSRHLVAALEELFALGAVGEGVRLTDPLGRRMAELPLAPSLAKMLLVAGEFGVSEEVASIVALLQVQSVFVKASGGRAHQARAMHAKFQVEEGDLLTLLNAYTAWERHNRSKRWAAQHYLNYGALMRASEIRGRMSGLVRRWGLDQSTEAVSVARHNSSTSIRRCITAGLFSHAAYLHHSGEYRTVRGDIPLNIHPSSVLDTLPKPKWLVYHELLHTRLTFMRDITVIEEAWLTELAPHYYRHGAAADDR